MRLKEANVLLKNKCYLVSYYLTGYAVECALKACNAKKTRRYDFPDKKFASEIYTHDLTKLLKLADLDKKLEEENRENELLKYYWLVIKDWNEELRYNLRIDKKKAIDAFNAVNDENYGIIR